jgi:hypothetical protein
MQVNDLEAALARASAAESRASAAEARSAVLEGLYKDAILSSKVREGGSSFDN